MAQATSVAVTVALVGLEAADRRAVTSAISTLSAAQALPATLTWAEEAVADIVVLNIDTDAAAQQLDRLMAETPRSVVRYSARRALQADVWRPIRVQGLRDALNRAVADTLERPALVPSAATPNTATLRSRGAALLQRASATATASSAPGQQMYRGQLIETASTAAPEPPAAAPAEAGAVRMYRGKAY